MHIILVKHAREETSIGEDESYVMFGIYVDFDSFVPCRVNLTYVCQGHLTSHSFYTKLSPIRSYGIYGFIWTAYGIYHNSFHFFCNF